MGKLWKYPRFSFPHGWEEFPSSQKSEHFKTRQTWVQSLFGPWTWACHFTSLGLSFFICKLGINFADMRIKETLYTHQVSGLRHLLSVDGQHVDHLWHICCLLAYVLCRKRHKIRSWTRMAEAVMLANEEALACGLGATLAWYPASSLAAVYLDLLNAWCEAEKDSDSKISNWALLVEGSKNIAPCAFCSPGWEGQREKKVKRQSMDRGVTTGSSGKLLASHKLRTSVYHQTWFPRNQKPDG